MHFGPSDAGVLLFIYTGGVILQIPRRGLVAGVLSRSVRPLWPLAQIWSPHHGFFTDMEPLESLST